jgi:hypothetical protein
MKVVADWSFSSKLFRICKGAKVINDLISRLVVGCDNCP